MQPLLSLLFVCAFPDYFGDLCDLYLRPAPRELKIEGSDRPPSSAIDRQPRVWRALSGDRVELDGTAYDLKGVVCPDPGGAEGRRAKALLNTFLRGGSITCRIEGNTATCRKEGRDMATGLIASGLCFPRVPQSEAATRRRDDVQFVQSAF
ncbi:hypothetical protein [Roseovarius aestuariivivens]|uniref:hypothetical protein n=1 Tax=Roseovarius aestuariivivens TaxID=1888910 RepID=UPI001081AE77|nr:hypothetical protein [Roseovarius aestuariivivens]